MARWLQVVLNVPVYQSFTYAAPEGKEEENFRGKRAEVFFGRQKTTAYIIAETDDLCSICSLAPEKIKPVLRILDAEVLFTDELIRLAEWEASYYLCSVGEALAAMLPSGRRESLSAGFAFDEDSFDAAAHALSAEQETAVQEILSSVQQQTRVMDNGSETKSLLHYLYGMTGSGKTEVFLRTAEEMLRQEKGVIYLVPEIGLTHQVIDSVIRRFGQTAAVLHSGLTPSQRLSQWMRILRREARVVIGARSAVFAPVPELGLIIIDEEHDGSYKSGNTPRYHARQVAIRRGSGLGIPLVMGSATPSVEAWYLMENGRIIRHTLSGRLSGGAPPRIEAVNLTGSGGCLSAALIEEIRETKKAGRQSILFLNRRGFTHFFRCNTCGYELTCKNCSVALTYHKSKEKMICHYCGWSVNPPAVCPECSSIDVGYAGFGTEFIETEVRNKFPDYTIARIDTDSLTKKGELQETLNTFRSGKIDILLGTQMVAKGLNFPGVRLVGVVLADTGLHMPDFRAAERTFALITQVAGRAGRFFPDGRVIVQSYNPGRAAIDYACRSDISGFYRQEMDARQMLEFPPFTRLIRLVFRSKSQQSAEKAASGAADIIREYLEKQNIPEDKRPEILGPAECPIGMISGNYRWQLLLRSESLVPIRKAVFRFLFSWKTPAGVYIETDVDPVSLL